MVAVGVRRRSLPMQRRDRLTAESSIDTLEDGDNANMMSMGRLL
jgi:hypothetical protein